jgi:hypothetical protein
MELSGAVSGSLVIRNVVCSSSSEGATQRITGTVGDRTYEVSVRAPRPGAYQLGSSAAVAAGVTAELSSSTAAAGAGSGAQRWSAGGAQAPGAGALTVGDAGGTIDADLPSTPTSSGSVHIRGAWSCA